MHWPLLPHPAVVFAANLQFPASIECWAQVFYRLWQVKKTCALISASILLLSAYDIYDVCRSTKLLIADWHAPAVDPPCHRCLRQSESAADQLEAVIQLCRATSDHPARDCNLICRPPFIRIWTQPVARRDAATSTASPLNEPDVSAPRALPKHRRQWEVIARWPLPVHRRISPASAAAATAVIMVVLESGVKVADRTDDVLTCLLCLGKIKQCFALTITSTQNQNTHQKTINRVQQQSAGSIH